MGEVPREAGSQEGGCCRMDPLLRGGGGVDSSDQQKFWRIMSSCHLFALCALSSSLGAKLKKELLRQYLYLGLPGGLMKQLSTGTSIAWRRMCKGDDLDDGVLMPKLS